MGKKIWLATILSWLIFIMVGCNTIGGGYDDNDKYSGQSNNWERVLSIDPEPRPEEHTITLYFKHEYCDYLVPETRRAVRDKQTWEQLVVEELLKGPSQHERVSIMPSGVEVLDVSRRDETVFVNLSREFTEDINLLGIPGKEDIPEEKKALAKAEMKRLWIYSIVNSLTELEGVNQVKFLVEKRAVSYADMDENLQRLMSSDAKIANKESSSNAVLVALIRDRDYILTPAKSVSTLFESIIGDPDWDKAYSLLARGSDEGVSLPQKEELKKLWPAIVSGIELEKDFMDEEIKPDGRAFVTVSYTINFVSGRKEKMNKDKIIVINENDIWKVRLPKFLSKAR